MSANARNKYIGNSCAHCVPVSHKGCLPAIWNPADVESDAHFATRCNKKQCRSLWYDIISEKQNEMGLMGSSPWGFSRCLDLHVRPSVRLGRGSKILRAIISDSGPGLYAQKSEIKRGICPKQVQNQEVLLWFPIHSQTTTRESC